MFFTPTSLYFFHIFWLYSVHSNSMLKTPLHFKVLTVYGITEWLQVYVYNVSFTAASSISCKSLHEFYRNLALVRKAIAHLDQNFQFSIPLSSYMCPLFVTWPRSLFTEHCPWLHPEIGFWLFYKAFCYDSDVPNN